MGAGIHGGFGRTIGNAPQEVPVNNHNNVIYSKKKTEGYLLNLDHPVGGSKAKFMKEVLGYSQNDSRLFHRNVVSSIMGKKPTKTEQTLFGTKHTYHNTLVGKNGRSVSANVVVVIQKDYGKTAYKIITVYPD